MFKITKERITLGGIAILASILRLVRLARSDMLTDAAHYSFRAIGCLDYLSPNTQTTPIVWFGTKPWWSLLSFHDHPPLIFWIEHIFFKIFGVNVFVARLPSALFGIGSVVLVYFFVKELYGKYCGYAAAFVLAICSYHTSISRLGYLESGLIFFVLLSLLLFVKALDEEKYFIYFGISLGLAFLSKYTAFFLVPALFIYLLIWQRRVFSSKRFWIGLLLCLIIFSPVIIYNLKMYQTRGHFDMQFSALLGQSMSDWSNIQRSVSHNPFTSLPSLWRSLTHSFSPAILLLFCLGIIYLFVSCRKYCQQHSLIIILLFFLTLFFLFTKTSDYFISVYVIFAAAIIGYSLIDWAKFLRNNQKYIFIIFIGLVFCYVLFFNVNTNLSYNPKGGKNIFYSSTRAVNIGFNQLEDFLKQKIMTGDGIFKEIDSYDDLFLVDAEGVLKTNPRTSDVFIFDDDLNWFARFWYFRRRIVYQKVFFVSSREFLILKEQGVFEKIRQSYRDFYFIKGIHPLLRDAGEYASPFAEEMENILIEQFKLEPINVIKNPKNEEAFKIYKF